VDEVLSITSEYYIPALGHIYGYSPFAEPPMKFVELELQVVDE
jgi:hypothetical protein